MVNNLVDVKLYDDNQVLYMVVGQLYGCVTECVCVSLCVSVFVYVGVCLSVCMWSFVYEWNCW